MHKKDRELLALVQASLGGIGSINEKTDSVIFKVRSLKQISDVILPQFDLYPLIGQKQADYLFFREVVKMMERKEHLTEKGLLKIVGIKATMNRGRLSAKLKAAFPHTTPLTRSLIDFHKIPHPQ